MRIPFDSSYPRSILGIVALLIALGWGSSIFGQAPNDDCVNAEPAVPGIPFFTTGATTDGPDLAGFCDPGPGPDDQIYNDVWFCYDAPFTSPVLIEVLPFIDEVRFAVYDGCTCPADPADVIICGEFPPTSPTAGSSFSATAGQSYLVRIGGIDPGSFPEGILIIDSFIPTPTNLVCDDSSPGEVAMTWDLPVGSTFTSIEIQVNGVTEASLAGTATDFLYTIPAGVTLPIDLCVVALSASGTAVTCCTVGFTGLGSDDCSGAPTLITGFPVDFDNGGATTDGPDLAPFCDPGPGADDNIYEDVWYCWTADFDGPYLLDLLAFGPEVRAAIYEGCDCPVDPGSVIACGEASGLGIPGTPLDFDAVAGQSYAIRLGASIPGGPAFGVATVVSNVPPLIGLACDDSTPGTVELAWTLPAGFAFDSIEVRVNGLLEQTLTGASTSTNYDYLPGFVGFLDFAVRGVIAGGLGSPDAFCQLAIGGPDNDECPDALDVTSGDWPFDTSLATDGPLPILLTCPPGPIGLPPFIFQDIWFRYQAPITTTATISLCGSSFDTSLAIYDDVGLCPPDLAVELACGDNECGLQSEVDVPVTAGMTYLIRVGGQLDPLIGVGNSGPGVLTIEDGTITPPTDIFRRGDTNNDGGFDISDPVSALAVLFTVGTPAPDCLDAADANDDGTLDISDPVYSLAALFQTGSPAPPDPGTVDCGVDPSDDSLDCENYDCN